MKYIRKLTSNNLIFLILMKFKKKLFKNRKHLVHVFNKTHIMPFQAQKSQIYEKGTNLILFKITWLKLCSGSFVFSGKRDVIVIYRSSTGNGHVTI
jgi:hypothetical protein